MIEYTDPSLRRAHMSFCRIRYVTVYVAVVFCIQMCNKAMCG